jgi:membrane peptidoglycan carboxypeptidase
LISTISAVFVDIKEKELVTGGSSITQQLAKNMYFSQDKKFSRKFAEIFVVSYLEEHLSKDEILELYLNTIYYGNGYYGIGNASIGYFDKLPSELSKSEATILAGLPKAPSVYSLSQNENLALNRQQQVIDAMVRYGYIKKEDVNSFKMN